jgi:uncharacterized protein YdbL (DUF1318 family)
MIRRTLISAIAGAAVAVMAAGAAFADPAQSKALVDAAKAAGAVGEQSDGYLNFVAPSSDAALKAAVAEINAGRNAVYKQAAASAGNGATPEAAGVSAFKQVIEPKLKPGEYYRTPAGAWVKK